MVAHKIIPYEILYEAICTTKELVDGGPEKNELLVLKVFLKYMKIVVKRYLDDADNGLPIIGHHFAWPTEIFYCFDFVPVVFEGIPYILSALLPQGSEYYYEIADSFGHPYHSCTSQKGTMGMMLDGLFQFDVITTPSSPCDNTFGTYPIINQIYNKKFGKKTPFIVADMPYYRDERSYEYYGKELQRVVNEVGNAIGQDPDYGKLRKAVEISNEVIQTVAEINELRKLKPCPIESMLCPLMTAVMAFIPGQPERALFFKDVLEIAKKRAKKGERAHDGEEKVRSVWPYMSVFFDIGFCEWLDRKLGLVMLMDIFNYLFFDIIDTSKSEQHIFEGLARQSMNFPMVRQSATFCEDLIEDFVYLSKEYEADCAIFTAHLGCKQSVSVIQLLREALREEVGIPMLTIDIDIGDARFTSIQTVKKEITNFVNTLL
ncbi:MAG: 2-hydroxyacyl-CoA dehydratase family protein [Promethearchaeota archaeon]